MCNGLSWLTAIAAAEIEFSLGNWETQNVTQCWRQKEKTPKASFGPQIQIAQLLALELFFNCLFLFVLINTRPALGLAQQTLLANLSFFDLVGFSVFIFIT